MLDLFMLALMVLACAIAPPDASRISIDYYDTKSGRAQTLDVERVRGGFLLRAPDEKSPRKIEDLGGGAFRFNGEEVDLSGALAAVAKGLEKNESLTRVMVEKEPVRLTRSAGLIYLRPAARADAPLIVVRAAREGAQPRAREPAKRPGQGAASEPASQEKLGKLLVSVAEKDHPRKYGVQLLDLDSGESKTLIQGGPERSSVAIGVSPGAKHMVLLEKAPRMEGGQEHGSESRYAVRSFAEPGKVVRLLSGEHYWPIFLDEKRLITAGPAQGEGEDAKRTVIKTVAIEGGEEVEMHVVQGRIWDDVPFQLSPDKKRLVYYRRGEGQRGLMVFDIEAGKATLLSETGSFFTWAPDGEHGYLFQKKAKRLDYVKVPRGKPVEVVKDFGADSVLGTPLGKEAFVYARFNMSDKFRPLGFTALHRTSASGAELTVSKSIPLDEFSILRCFVQLRETQSFVFAEAVPGAEDLRKAPRQLVLARVREGKLERKVLMDEKQSIGFPISLP